MADTNDYVKQIVDRVARNDTAVVIVTKDKVYDLVVEHVEDRDVLVLRNERAL